MDILSILQQDPMLPQSPSSLQAQTQQLQALVTELQQLRLAKLQQETLELLQALSNESCVASPRSVVSCLSTPSTFCNSPMSTASAAPSLAELLQQQGGLQSATLMSITGQELPKKPKNRRGKRGSRGRKKAVEPRAPVWASSDWNPHSNVPRDDGTGVFIPGAAANSTECAHDDGSSENGSDGSGLCLSKLSSLPEAWEY